MNTRCVLTTALLCIGLIGCESVTGSSSDRLNLQGFKSSVNLFDIKGPDQIGTWLAEQHNHNVRLGTLSIIDWPLATFPCETCSGSLTRHHHPDGPSLLLSLTNNKGINTWAVSTYQTVVNFPPWKFHFAEKEIAITDTASKKTTALNSNVLNAIDLDTPNACELLWANNRMQSKQPAHISKDVAQFKSQVIIQCRD